MFQWTKFYCSGMHVPHMCILDMCGTTCTVGTNVQGKGIVIGLSPVSKTGGDKGRHTAPGLGEEPFQ